MTETLMDKPIPSLAKWLGEERADDFEAFEVWTRDVLYRQRQAGNEDEAATLRVLRTFTIACMEICKQETEEHARDPIDTVRILARMAGTAVMGPVMCVLDETKNPPWRRVARMMTEEFGHGADLMAKRAAQGDT